jgi:hypothetical protein
VGVGNKKHETKDRREVHGKHDFGSEEGERRETGK